MENSGSKSQVRRRQAEKNLSLWGELLGSCVWAIQRHDDSRLTSLLFHTGDDQGFWFPKAGQIMTIPESSLGNGLEHTAALNVFLSLYGKTENDFLTPGNRSWEHLGLSPSGIMGTPTNHLQGSLPGNLSGLLICYQSSRHSFVCLLLHISMCVFTCLCRCICICVPICGGWSLTPCLGITVIPQEPSIFLWWWCFGVLFFF